MARLSTLRRGAVLASGDSSGADWPLFPVLLAYLALLAGIAWPWVFGFVTIPWDAKAHFQPQIQFLADSIARGDWPWWNPFVFSGQPQVADPQSMIFSPPFLLLALVNRAPSLWAADMTVLAAIAAGGLGLILWIRDQAWHWAGALLAALVFSFGAAMGWRIQHTGQVLSLAYWPWALLALDRTVARRSLGYGLLLGVVASFIVLGRDQVALLCLYVLAGRVLWLWATADTPSATIVQSLPPLVLGGLATVALVAVPVLMTVLLAVDSNRPVIDFEGAGRGSLHPALLVTFVLPQLFGAAGHMADYWGPPSFAWPDTGLFIAQNVGQMYIGAIPLLLIAGAAALGRLWDREVRFFTLAAVLVLLYALGWYTPAFRAFYELLPGVKLYRRPADAVFLVGALAAILAGYAAHRVFTAPWVRPEPRVILAGVAIVGLALVTALALGIRLDRLQRMPGPLLGGGLAFAAAIAALVWAQARVALTPWRAALGLAAITAADLSWNNGPTSSSALPPAYYDVLEPATRNGIISTLKQKTVAGETRRDRVELAGLGFHWPNASMTHRLENTLGYNPIRLGLYSRATGAEDHVGLPDQRKFSKLMPSYVSPLSNMLGLRFIATGAPIETMDKALKPGALPLVAETPDGYIYENTNALPRVLFAREARFAPFAPIVESGQWPDFNPRSTVLLEEIRGGKADRRPGVVRILTYANSVVTVEVNSPDGGYVVLNDIWHPWWFATIDGAPAEMLRANVLFRAVEVPAGVHTVRFAFRPLAGLQGALAGRSVPSK